MGAIPGTAAESAWRDRKLATIIELENDDLEHVARPIGAEMQASDRLLLRSNVVRSQGVLDRVEDVSISDAVRSGRLMNLHTSQS